MLFSYEDEDIGRFSNLHQCTLILVLGNGTRYLRITSVAIPLIIFGIQKHLAVVPVKNELEMPFTSLLCKSNHTLIYPPQAEKGTSAAYLESYCFGLFLLGSVLYRFSSLGLNFRFPPQVVQVLQCHRFFISMTHSITTSKTFAMNTLKIDIDATDTKFKFCYQFCT